MQLLLSCVRSKISDPDAPVINSNVGDRGEAEVAVETKKAVEKLGTI